MSENNDFDWRLSHLEISNFRGMIGTHHLNVDADLILIDGPNGHGKTSLLEAIRLILTGWHPRIGKGTEALRSRDLGCDENTGRPDQHHGTPVCKIVAKRGSLHSNEPTFPTNLILDLDNAPSKPENLPESPFRRATGSHANGDDHQQQLDRWALEARLMSFFQENVRDFFDDVASGRRLSQLFEENPCEVEKTKNDFIGRMREYIENRIKALPPTKIEPEEHSSFRDLCETFRTQYQQLADRHFPDWPPISPVPEQKGKLVYADSVLTWLEEFADNLSRKLTTAQFTAPYEFGKAIAKRIDERLAEYRAHADVDPEELKQLEKQLSEKQEALNQLNRKYPELEHEIPLFKHRLATDRCNCEINAADWFEVLAEKAEAWSKVISKTSNESTFPNSVDALARAKQQFARVDADLARQLAKAMRDWITPREHAWNEKQQLEQDIAKIKEKMRQARWSDDLKDLTAQKRSWRDQFNRLLGPWNRQREKREASRTLEQTKCKKALLEEAQHTLEQFEELLNSATGPAKEIQKQLGDITTSVLHRFALVEGFLPLRIDDSDQQGQWMPQTADGRPLNDLSTGQKSQTAVAMMAAQNLAAASGKLPPILILDDVSTSYDLTNLTREALLWRQLAYGGDGKYRRQVFISSHHEDMTNNLIDLLTPPAGRRMRLLRFVSWDPCKGPEIEQYEVEPTAPAFAYEKSHGAEPAYEPTPELKNFEEALCQLPY